MEIISNFNYLEGFLWLGVAVVLGLTLKPSGKSQRSARWLAVMAFVIFGVSDWLEARSTGAPPLWLYALKIACGAAIFASRFFWLGWRQWHWKHPQFLFGLFCLIAVLFAIWFQHFRD